MKITINVADLIFDIKKALVEYDKEYVKLLKLYHSKLIKYNDYVSREISTDEVRELKHPPFPPTWLRDNIVDSLQALQAHQEDTVQMDDREYSSIKKGIE